MNTRIVGAAAALQAVVIWWEIQLNPHNRALDARLETAAASAIAAADRWTRREPGRAEAWFYLGAGYAARSQWRSLRGEPLAAARDGKRIKDALEQATRLDSGLRDARFGLGLYQYYADVVPGALKVLRWLLLLPGGDRAAGLRAMEEARTYTIRNVDQFHAQIQNTLMPCQPACDYRLHSQPFSRASWIFAFKPMVLHSALSDHPHSFDSRDLIGEPGRKSAGKKHLLSIANRRNRQHGQVAYTPTVAPSFRRPLLCQCG